MSGKKAYREFYQNHKKKIITFTIFFAIIISLWFFLNFNLNIHLNSDPQIIIDPPQASMQIKNDMIEFLEYNIDIDKPMLCQTNCDYKFVDRSHSRIVQNSTLDLKRANKINVSMTGPGRGSGEKIYNLEVICKVPESFFCSEAEVKKSSFAVLSYELTPKEKELKETLREPLLSYFEMINNIHDSIYKIDKTLAENPAFTRSKEIKLQIGPLASKVDALRDNAKYIISLWESEEYIKIEAQEITEKQKEAKRIIEHINLIENTLNSYMLAQNSTITKYNSNLKLFNQMINSSASFLQLNSSLELYLNAQSIENSYKDIYLNYIANNFSENQFSGNVTYLLKSQEDFKNKLEEQKFSREAKLNSIINEEQQKRCMIGDCEKMDKASCEIIYEFLSKNKYPITSGAIVEYNNSFYNSSGVIVNPLKVNSSKLIELNSTLFDISDGNILIKDTGNISHFYLQNCKLNPDRKINLNLSQLNYLHNVSIQDEEIKNHIETDLVEKLPQCCIGGRCTNCCLEESCRQDPSTYPVLLIHGHSLIKSSPTEPSIDALNKISYEFVGDGFIDAGILSFSNISSDESSWQYLTSPIVVKASYYYETYYSLGSYVYVTQKNDNIDTYAIRLSEIVNELKERTQRPKVNIVAHSMGGLVVRRYMQIFGSDSVNKVILVGTPNHGISGRTKYLCSVVGEDLECEDMYDDSILIAKLNDPNYKPDANVYTISGTGCDTVGEDGDGIVTLNSSLLSYAKSYIIEGNCTDMLNTNLHTDLIDVDKYPQVYAKIAEILKSNETN